MIRMLGLQEVLTLEQRTIDQKFGKMPSALELPDEAVEAAESQGIIYRWIRESVLGRDDKTNVSKRFREGFVPVRPDELPGFHDFAYSR
jgi:hypothetical protein